MSNPEDENLEEPEFKWGKKRGIGEKNKDVQFYESFTYDRVDYALYDCVYMYKHGELAPYIGKLVKIWQNPDMSRKVKVHWFFRPSEICYHLRDVEVLENELFFASGAGTGLANLNPLEAIAGKCNIVCTSSDSRNPPPSAEEIQKADFIFYRTFDVDSFRISDTLPDTVGGHKVAFVFNRKEIDRSLDVAALDSISKDEGGTAIACKETSEVSGKNTLQQLNNPKKDENSVNMLGKKDTVVVGHDKSNNGSSEKLLVTNASSKKPPMKRSLNTSPDLSKEKPTIGHDEDNKDIRLAKDLCPTEGPSKKAKIDHQFKVAEDSNSPSKKAKTDHLVKVLDESNNGTVKKMKEKIGSLKRSSNTLSKEKPTIGHGGNKDVRLAKDLCPVEGSSKKAKIDHPVKVLEDNNNATGDKMKEKIGSSQTKNSHLLGPSYDDKAKSRFDKSSLSECQKDKMDKLSGTREDGLVTHKVFEVARRPLVKSTWMKLPWEQKMKTAQDQERLVLLQNLDPEYTSGEVADIIWHAFNENCEAKMVQHTATSNPNSGQAFVIFNSRNSVKKVAQKLDEVCLMLPNKRPLVIYTEVPKFGVSKSFVGHLAIDKARRQQREMKDAVSTSHYSQNNTIEYEMAMAWCLLQSKSNKWWERLYKQQRAELKKLQDNLKLK